MQIDKMPQIVRKLVSKKTFELLVEKDNPNSCWLWLGGISAGGYGTYYIAGKSVYAHRLSYILYRGDISNNLWVLHSCDIPRCVNPSHLRLGTSADNVADMLKRDRHSHRYGPRYTQRKVLFQDEELIKLLYDQGLSQRDIAKRLDISQWTVWNILNNRPIRDRE